MAALSRNHDAVAHIFDEPDGECIECGGVTFFCPADYAPADALANDGGAREHNDYYVWCSNQECQNNLGTLVGDQECPPKWARHGTQGDSGLLALEIERLDAMARFVKGSL